MRFVIAIWAFENIPREGRISAARLAAEVGSEKTLISISLFVVNSFGEGTIMVRAFFLALVRMMRMLVADGLLDEVEQVKSSKTKTHTQFALSTCWILDMNSFLKSCKAEKLSYW